MVIVGAGNRATVGACLNSAQMRIGDRAATDDSDPKRQRSPISGIARPRPQADDPKKPWSAGLIQRKYVRGDSE